MGKRGLCLKLLIFNNSPM